MTQFNMYEAKTNLSKIGIILDDGIEDQIIISKNGKPSYVIKKYSSSSRANFFGCAKGKFSLPKNFDDIDLSDEFEELI